MSEEEDLRLREERLTADLLRPENLPIAGGPVELRSTHISRVFLAPDQVFKVKRAKDYGFLDFRSLERRRFYCEEELRLNRRSAPGVYLDVLPVRLDAIGHSLVRGGEIVDWAVHMRRLADADCALQRLGAGLFERPQVDALARFLVTYFRSVAAVDGTVDLFHANLDENFTQARSMCGDLVEDEVFGRIRERQLDWFAREEARMRRRRGRDGHGDLRLEHVYFAGEKPILIDCIEFLDRFRQGDPALDLAFLHMDLNRLLRPDLAEYLVARYAWLADDYELYPLIDGFAAYRAFVRAKVAGFVARDPATPADAAARKARESRETFLLADRLSRPRGRGAWLAAVGGLIAAGKSRLASALAETEDCVPVSADTTRKSMVGVGHEESAGAEAYTAEMNRRVQDELLERCRLAIEAGRSVVVDSTFSERQFRRRMAALAEGLGARFLFVECRAPEPVLRRRLAARQGGISDAREDLLDSFLQRYEPVDELDAARHLVVDSSDLAQDPLPVLRSRLAQRFDGP